MCEHDLSDRETACADGMCPLCLAAENAALREENERLTAANKARAEYLTNRRAGNDLDSYVNLAETKIEELRAQLAEAQEELAQWRATGESVTRNEHDLSARLAALEAERALIVARAENAERGLVEAEQILSACYSPVRLIAEGGSRTRADLDLAAETFAALKRYLKPEAARLDAHLSRKP